MEQELQRIRGKDYSQIDQTLFEQMGRADDLSHTLTQLSDFQRFLMAQIATLNDPASTPAQALKNSIAKNIDVLKESLVQCSRMRERTDRGDRAVSSNVGELRKKVGQLRAEVKQVKEGVGKKVRQAVQENAKMWEEGMKQVVERYAKLEREKEVLGDQCSQLGQENRGLREQLRQMEQELHQAKQKCHQLERDSMQPTFVRNSHTPTPSLTFQPTFDQLKTEGDHHTTPLRQPYPDPSPTHPFPLKQRHNSREPPAQPRHPSLKRQTSNHLLPRKQHPGKQNETLVAFLSKGVRLQQARGKSKQKLKVFSMF